MTAESSFTKSIGIANHMAFTYLLRATRFIANHLECVGIVRYHYVRIDRIQDRLKPGFQLFGIFTR